MKDEFSDAMKALTRDHLRALWLSAKAGEPLEGEEATLARAMKQHTEYLNIWERLDELGIGEIVVDGVNPIMHVNMHSIIENQLAQNDPPEVRKALDGLLKRGTPQHDAIHAIAYEFNMELFPVLKHSRPFNNGAYKRRLEKIARGRK